MGCCRGIYEHRPGWGNKNFSRFLNCLSATAPRDHNGDGDAKKMEYASLSGYIPLITHYIGGRTVHFRDWEPGYRELWQRWAEIDVLGPHMPQTEDGVRSVSDRARLRWHRWCSARHWAVGTVAWLRLRLSAWWDSKGSLCLSCAF